MERIEVAIVSGDLRTYGDLNAMVVISLDDHGSILVQGDVVDKERLPVHYERMLASIFS